MSSVISKRSIIIDGHKTSLSLEDPFWSGLKEIAKGQEMTLSAMVGQIDTGREQGNLSSAIRLFVLKHARARALLASSAGAGAGAMLNGGTFHNHG